MFISLLFNINNANLIFNIGFFALFGHNFRKLHKLLFKEFREKIFIRLKFVWKFGNSKIISLLRFRLSNFAVAIQNRIFVVPKFFLKFLNFLRIVFFIHYCSRFVRKRNKINTFALNQLNFLFYLIIQLNSSVLKRNNITCYYHFQVDSLISLIYH